MSEYELMKFEHELKEYEDMKISEDNKMFPLYIMAKDLLKKSIENTKKRIEKNKELEKKYN